MSHRINSEISSEDESKWKRVMKKSKKALKNFPGQIGRFLENITSNIDVNHNNPIKKSNNNQRYICPVCGWEFNGILAICEKCGSELK